MLDIKSNAGGQMDSSDRVSEDSQEQKIIGLGKPNKTNFIILFSLISLGIFISVSAFLFFYKLMRQADLEAKENVFTELNTKLKSKEMSGISQKARRLDAGLGEIDIFLAQRPRFYTLIGELKKITPSEVKLSNLTVDEKANCKISGETDNYNNLAKFLALMKNSDKFSNVMLFSANTTTKEESGSRVDFSISAEIVPTSLTSSWQQNKVSSDSSDSTINKGASTKAKVATNKEENEQ